MGKKNLKILVHPSCPACQRIKKELPCAEFISILDEEGRKLAEELDISYVPFPVLKKGKKHEKCVFDALDELSNTSI